MSSRASTFSYVYSFCSHDASPDGVFLAMLSWCRPQVNSNGNVVRSEILGAVKMKCYLSGMPELRLGLNDKVMFENTGRSMSSSYPFSTALLSPTIAH